MSNEGEKLLCGACGAAIDRAGDWYLCDHRGDSLHAPADCDDVWHPHQLYYFCNKGCARGMLKSAHGAIFELQQPPRARRHPALALPRSVVCSLFDGRLRGDDAGICSCRLAVYVCRAI